MSKKQTTTITLTEESRDFLKENKFRTDEKYGDCIDRLIREEKERNKQDDK